MKEELPSANTAERTQVESSAAAMRKLPKQRLVICLDGTWNNRDDTTNVLHHFDLAIEGLDQKGVRQRRYYHKGVGTGVLDSVSGGAFGLGLEQNVRDAYNWIVQQYQDGDPDTPPDEIYIFGFSRGAYTARSLVGFIGTFGVLRHGAPISVNELWDEYCILGRYRERRKSFWDTIFGDPQSGIRRINDLICDPWRIEAYENFRSAQPNYVPPDGIKRVAGQLVDQLDLGEWLLIRWARRVRITYLGVYDTVGAMGIDALAIPGLKSKLAMHHNMRPTTLIQNCRHALALDEHRTSFRHTPFVQYVGHADDDEDNQQKALQQLGGANAEPHIGKVAESAELHWRKQHEMWKRKIEQRWFVGAHSNVGGGYPDNALAQRPLEWLLEGAKKVGLHCEPFSHTSPAKMPSPNDSFSEFIKPLWTEVIRAKRYYRVVDPDPEMSADPDAKLTDNPPPAGFTLQTIHEEIDQTAFDRFRTDANYRPLNLIEYACRKSAQQRNTEAADLQSIETQKPEHRWLTDRLAAPIYLIVWATIAAVGLLTLNGLFFAPADWRLPTWMVCVSGFLFASVDWCESRANFASSVRGSAPVLQASLDSAYWARSIGFISFVFGVLLLAPVWLAGWNSQTPRITWDNAFDDFRLIWPVPIVAGLVVMLTNWIDRASLSRQLRDVIGICAGAFIVYLLIFVTMFFGWIGHYALRPAFGELRIALSQPAQGARLPGLTLLALVLLAIFAKAWSWVGEPMSRHHLGSITPLQRQFTPEGVQGLLEKWRIMLACRWDPRDADYAKGPAAETLHKVLREALWRDVFGFIPVYAAVLMFGLWFSAARPHLTWLSDRHALAPLCLLIPLIAAVADYAEDICHFSYIRAHERGQPPSGFITVLSFTMSSAKSIVFFVAFLTTIAGIGQGIWAVSESTAPTGWRGAILLLSMLLAAIAIVVLATSAVIYRFRWQSAH